MGSSLKRTDFLKTLTSSPAAALFVCFVVSFALKVWVIGAGAPFVTIDDGTAFDGGFLVWLGHAPVHRMYLESWLHGLLALITFACRVLFGFTDGSLDAQIVVSAYRDYYFNPGPYVLVHRWFVLTFDMCTAFMVYVLAKRVFNISGSSWQAALPAMLYLLAFNTVWCNVVARPDSLVAFFSTAGVLAYVSSDVARNTRFAVAAAILLGIAAGLKLHAALFAVVVCADILRVRGIRGGIIDSIIVAGISFVFFCIAAGSVIFDPSRYVKLRFMNYVDDFSPWINWWDHVVILTNGVGWLALPLLLIAIYRIGRRIDLRSAKPIYSIWLMCVVWLIVFIAIRQLRAYWMLPVLPLFYIVISQVCYEIKAAGLRRGLVVALIALQGFSFVNEALRFDATNFGENQSVVRRECRRAERHTFWFRFSGLTKSREANSIIERSIEAVINEDLVHEMPYLVWRLKNWEEQQVLMQIRMLGRSAYDGYNIFPYHVIAPDRLDVLLGLHRVDIVVSYANFPLTTIQASIPNFSQTFEEVAETMGPGGGGDGLRYRIYRRITVHGGT